MVSNVRWRLTLWYGTVLATILVGFGATVFFMMRQALAGRTDFELDEEVDELALEVRLATDEQNLQDQLRHRFFSHASFDSQVSDAQGRILFRSARLESTTLSVPVLSPGAPDLVTTERLGELGPCRIVHRQIDSQAGRFIVQCVSSLQANRQQLQALLFVLLTAGPLAIAGALASGYLLARKTLAPVEQMRRAAEQITAERLDRRLDVANPDDELGRLAQTLNRMIDRLRSSVDEMRRFTADAAHELRTPLAVLRTEAEVALRAPRTTADYRRVVEIALDETNRLTHVADQLLILCRQEAGLRQPSSDDVQLDALLLDVVEKIRTTAARKGLEIDATELDPAVVGGDDIPLSQLFFNLLDNACKFTPQGGHVRVECRVRGREVCVSVADDGPGIPADHLPHVFTRFHRVDPSRNSETGGAGLGLAICKAIAEAHGGRISVKSQLGVGTSFEVLLPAAGSSVGLLIPLPVG